MNLRAITPLAPLAYSLPTTEPQPSRVRGCVRPATAAPGSDAGECTGECPFVNRADARCSSHLSLGGVNFAYDHCFDDYTACPLHAELEDERRAELTIRRRPLHHAA